MGHILGIVAASFGGGIVGSVFALVIGYDPITHPAGLALVVIGQSAASFGVVVAVSRKAGSGDLRRDFGLVIRPRDATGILWGFGLQIGAALLVAPLIRALTGDSETQQQVVELTEVTTDVGGRVLLVVLIVAIAPFIEELIFRGAVLSWLTRHFSVRWAVVLSAAAFAGIHLSDPDAWPAVPSLFVIGLVLGWAAQRRKSLSLPIFLHAGVNLLGVMLLMFGEDLFDIDGTSNQVESLMAVIGIG